MCRCPNLAVQEAEEDALASQDEEEPELVVYVSYLKATLILKKCK